MSTSTSPPSHPRPVPTRVKPPDGIRRQVDERHWQLFETRLKTRPPEINKENYTKSNDYRVIDRFKKVDQLQAPVEPNQRWQTFCSQLTEKSNETTRLMSIFHHVWIKNWNSANDDERHRQQRNDLLADKNTFLKHLSPTEEDKKMISSILHRNV